MEALCKNLNTLAPLVSENIIDREDRERGKVKEEGRVKEGGVSEYVSERLDCFLEVRRTETPEARVLI